MQMLADAMPLFRSLWVVWFFALFLGMLWFVLRPSRRAYYDAQADIPLRDGAGDHSSRPGASSPR
jgi:cbb3-type cytochrome oxidase subunit 3